MGRNREVIDNNDRWQPDWSPEPLSGDYPDLDLAITDCFAAERLCLNSATLPDFVISIWNRDTHAEEKYEWISKARENTYRNPIVLVTEFDDVSPHEVDDPGSPKIEDIERILRITRPLREASSTSTRVLIHCAAGISRSSSTALAILASITRRREPALPAEEVARRAFRGVGRAVVQTYARGWREHTVWDPNALVVRAADKLLGLSGALLARRASGYGDPWGDDRNNRPDGDWDRYDDQGG